MAIVGGIIAGLGLGGAAAAVLECLGADRGPVAPIMVAGIGFGLGVGMLVASVISARTEQYGPALMAPIKG